MSEEEDKKNKKVEIDLKEEVNFNINCKFEGDDMRRMYNDPDDIQEEVDEENVSYESTYWDVDEDLQDAGYVSVVDDTAKQPVFDFFRTGIDMDGCVVVITGEKRSGKTCLSWVAADNYKGTKTIVAFAHPDPERVAEIRTKYGKKVYITSDFNWILRQNNLLILLDEPQLVFTDVNQLITFITVIGQHDSSLYMISNESRYFTDRLEFHVDAWILLDQNWRKVKRGSTIKYAVEPYTQFGIDNFILQRGEFVFYSRKHFRKYNNIWKFRPTDWYDERLSKPFKGRGTPHKAKRENEMYMIQQ